MSKKQTLIFIVLAATIVFTQVKADSGNNLLSALSSCSNPVAQAYTTTTHNSQSIIAADFSYYTSSDCTTGFTQSLHSTGTILLTSPAGTFFYCSANTDFSLGKTGCFNSAHSMNISSLATDTGPLVGNGNCLTLVCSGQNFTSWSATTTSTMTL